MPYTFVAPAVIFLGIFLIYPVFTTIVYSFEQVNVGGLLTGVTPFVGLQNYQHVLSDPQFQSAILVSLIFTVTCVVFQFTIGFLLALLFKERFPLAGPMRALLLIPWLLPLIVSATIFKWMLQTDNGIINYALLSFHLLSHPITWLDDPKIALVGPIIANIWIGIPFNMSLLMAGLQGIPGSLYEAATVEGARGWQQFRRITWPMMRAQSLAVLVLGTILTINVFDLIYVMTGGGPVDATTTLPLYAYQNSFVFYQLGNGAAATMLLFLFLLVVAVVYLALLSKEEVNA
ncbi:MAG TPA: sugar ABC transporter permease [Ktedonobacteraceae bacterium]|nr:sugar ABC transporter permease [Ktedonobacteraceae bacterium]